MENTEHTTWKGAVKANLRQVLTKKNAVRAGVWIILGFARVALEKRLMGKFAPNQGVGGIGGNKSNIKAVG